MKIGVLVVDDERTFVGYIDQYFRTCDSALAWFAYAWAMDQQIPIGVGPTEIEQLWLDHDLGPNDTIDPLVQFLYVLGRNPELYNPIPIRHIYVHSMNPPAADRIVNKLIGYYNITRVPLPELRER